MEASSIVGYCCYGAAAAISLSSLPPRPFDNTKPLSPPSYCCSSSVSITSTSALSIKKKNLPAFTATLRLSTPMKLNGRIVGATRCAKWVSESQLEADSDGHDDDDDWMRMVMQDLGKVMREKCGERKGAVEVLECLETEALMGDDHGRHPLDYNRRALIFDRSSRVFQALKDSPT